MKKLAFFIFLIYFFLLFPLPTYALKGLDVSEFQENIDFKKVKEDGIEVVYIRSSASFSYVDAKFERNYKEAKKNNLKIGFYHYVTARTVEEAKSQARFFATVIKGKEVDCYLAMDYESFPGLSKKEINDISEAFLKTLEEVTKKPVLIYSDAYNASFTFDRNLFKKYPLWLAEYGVDKPETDIDYIGWQYTDKGRVNGIVDDVDRDEFKDEIIIKDKTPIKEPDLKPEEKTKVIYYRVKWGDTLTKIAHEYDTTIKDILKENKIKNPNLIYPDEIIKIVTSIDHQITKKGSNTTYTVKKGNTLTYISYLFNTTVSNLVTWNDIFNPNLIFPFQKIIIKPTNNSELIKYQVTEYTNLLDIAKNYQTSLYELRLINHLKSDYLEPGTIIYIPETYLY